MDIRIVKQDNTYISNAYGNEPIVTIGCITRDTRISDTYVPFDIMQTIFLKYGGRPHWAKKHTLNSQDLNKLYPKCIELQHRHVLSAALAAAALAVAALATAALDAAASSSAIRFNSVL